MRPFLNSEVDYCGWHSSDAAERNPGVTYQVQFSDHLLIWGAAGQEVLVVDIDENFECVVWEDAPT